MKQSKGIEQKHYFGPMANDNRTWHWFERWASGFDLHRIGGLREGIFIEAEGDVFGLEGMMKPHVIERV